MASMYSQETSAVQDQQNPTLLYDALYCSEENWVDEVREDCFRDELEGESYSSNNRRSKIICAKDLETNPSLSRARCEAVEWILKKEKPWMTQLAAVSCLSLAAKVEETQVPLLLDFQVEDSKYVFEAKTIQRMEILVLSTLKWKMNPVTPISFLDYITRRLGLGDYPCLEFLKRCERMVLSILADFRSMPYVPSIMAAATMLHVIDNIEPSLAAEYQSQLLGILGIDKDKVEDCSQFLMEFAPRDNFKFMSNKRKFSSLPGSPSGVVDVSFSSDSSNDSWSVASSVPSSPKPQSKKSRALPSLNNATTSDLSQHSSLVP
ncbi:hypothetical protein OIU76_006302 [Salix suchowensis]|nr:hypothetical protein OIU76_006302 [Salix suchowensis]